MTTRDSPRPDVSIVVVSYNTCALTLACLETIHAQTHTASFEIIVVDNASADGSAKAIRERFPKVRVLPLAENFGFGRAVNHGAANASGRYLLILNPDTRVLDAAIDRLIALADVHPEARIYGGVTLNEDGSINPSSCWRRPSPWSVLCQALGASPLFPNSRLFSPQTVRIDESESLQRVDIVSGGFLLIDRSLWQELGGFEPSFFFYGEDFDLCLRAHEQGSSPVIFPGVRIIHHGGRSPLANGERLVRLFRAQVQLYKRHWEPAASTVGVAALMLWILTRRVAYRAARRTDQAGAWDEVWRRRAEFLDARIGRPLAPIRELHGDDVQGA